MIFHSEGDAMEQATLPEVENHNGTLYSTPPVDRQAQFMREQRWWELQAAEKRRDEQK